MAYFKISQPNKPTKWIKSIDRANGTLEFSEDRNGCFQQDSGFFADSEAAYLKFHFKEAYPEIEYMTIDTSWNAKEDEYMVGAPIQEVPNDPNEVEEDAPAFEAFEWEVVQQNADDLAWG